MDLIFWRHAEAEDGLPDLARKLTPKGVKQARAMAEWLRPRLPRRTRVIVSPAERARQTVRALTDDFEIVKDVAPGASHAALLGAAGWPHAEHAVLVVGHQPALGYAASLLLAGTEAEWSIKKGAVWWLSRRARREESQVVLRAVMSPDLL
ncbi:MAG TPA: histidine phosphatase family protein [Burkholderiales bacterium]|nr:histidine phosphatase family protein [Burkholderiales bacterium]